MWDETGELYGKFSASVLISQKVIQLLQKFMQLKCFSFIISWVVVSSMSQVIIITVPKIDEFDMKNDILT